MKRLVLCLSTVLLFSSVGVMAQTDGSFGLPSTRHSMSQMGDSTLSGIVRTQDNRPQRNARVELHALATGDTVASTYTLPNGTFEFDKLQQGIYEVVATAGVQEARERVELYQSSSSVSLLLPTQSADAGPLSARGTVSVAQLKIPSEAKKLFSKAEKDFQEQKLAKSREEVEKALHAFPNYAQALTLRGILNLQDSKFDAARADLEAAIKDDFSYGMSYIVLGATYNVLQRFDDSIRVLERGTALMPSSWQGHFELSKALLAKGQYDAALRQIDKAGQFGPANYGAIHLVRAHALLGLKNYDQAVNELEAFLGTDPNSADSARARQTLAQVRAFMSANGK